jgi:Cys-tRNA(Pro) deacylase
MTLEEKIVHTLQDQGIEFEILEHAPVYTNPTMAEALGVSEAETVKSLVLTTKEKALVVMVLPGHKKVDWKEAARTTHTKKVSFAKPDAVSTAVGCEVGCVPPFGHMTRLPIYMDTDLLQQTYVYFNPGVHHKSFKVRSRDLQKLCRAG